MTGAYLDPLFATICGVLVLHEQIGGATVLGMAAILAGVTLVNTTRFSFPWRRPAISPTSTA
jgi:drug/metabolite transporter (DMT)-like permease